MLATAQTREQEQAQAQAHKACVRTQAWQTQARHERQARVQTHDYLPVGLLSAETPQTGKLRWYVAHVREGQEEATASKCRGALDPQIAQECFVPMYEKYMKRGGYWQLVVDPMFRTYFFIAAYDARALSRALGRLSFPVALAGARGSACAALSPSVQQWLDVALDAHRVLRASEGVIVGNKLTVTCGPLAGREGAISRVDRHKRMAYVRLGEGEGPRGEGECPQGEGGFLLKAALSVPTRI